MGERFAGTAAGVPFTALPPPGGRRAGAPVVLAWHLLDPPRTELAFSAALPLEGLDAWRIYFGLPMSGSRTPSGGVDEVMRLVREDVVRNVHGPIVEQATAEFDDAFRELTQLFEFAPTPVGLVGGSLGAAVAQSVLLSTSVPVAAAVLISPVVRLRSMVEALGRLFDMPYEWTPPADEIAARLDFSTRVDEFVPRGEPSVLLLVGADDDPDAFLRPAESLAQALTARYQDPSRVRLATIPDMGHALALEPGIEPAPQTPQAANVEREAVRWLTEHLTSPEASNAAHKGDPGT